MSFSSSRLAAIFEDDKDRTETELLQFIENVENPEAEFKETDVLMINEFEFEILTRDENRIFFTLLTKPDCEECLTLATNFFVAAEHIAIFEGKLGIKDFGS